MSNDQTTTIIQTKLTPPQIGSGLVFRPRLNDYLNHDLDRTFTLISSSAGYGKTTLLVQWLTKVDRPVAWLSLDDYDSDIVVFLSYFLAAIRKLYPQGAELTQALLQTPDPPPEAIVAALISDIAALEEAIILVLDDYHAIEDGTVGEVVALLLDHMPPNLHLVIATRHDPLLPLPRIRASGRMKELRNNALRFTRQEVATFMSNVGVEALTTTEIGLISERTEGWVAGLRLAALTIGNSAGRETFFRGFGKTADPLIVEYLVAEVLSLQRPEVQSFLLFTSILDRMCAPLCEALLGTGRCQLILDELLQTNLFVATLEHNQTWYRYHNLFQNLLQRRLQERENSAKIEVLHSRASSWLADQILVEEALRHALAAGEVEAAGRLVEEHRVGLLNHEDWGTLRRWIEQLPKEFVATRPALLLTQTWIAVYQFDPLAIHTLLNRAENVLNERLDELSPEQATAVQGEIDALYSYYLQTFDTKPDLSLMRAEQALARIPKENATARGLAQDFRAFAIQTLGRLDEAVRLLEDMIGDPIQPSGVKTQAFIALGFIYFNAGDLKALARNATRHLTYASDLGRLPSVAWANYFAGVAAYERNDLQTTLQHVSAVIDLSQYAVYLTYHSSTLLLAKTLWATGQKTAAQTLLDEHESALRERGNPPFLQDVVALRASFAVELGDISNALQWASQIDPATLVEPLFTENLAGPYWAQVLTPLAARSGLQGVQSYLEQGLVLVKSRHNVRRQIKILAQLSLVNARLKKTDMALKQVGRCLELAQPRGFVRTIIELGPGMAELLERYAESDVADNNLGRYATQLRALFDVNDGPRSDVETTMAFDPANPLTSREMDVLSLLAEGLMYREIAATLVISPLTVKKHASNIYGKLGVNNRRQAAAAARSMGLLIDR